MNMSSVETTIRLHLFRPDIDDSSAREEVVNYFFRLVNLDRDCYHEFLDRILTFEEVPGSRFSGRIDQVFDDVVAEQLFKRYSKGSRNIIRRENVKTKFSAEFPPIEGVDFGPTELEGTGVSLEVEIDEQLFSCTLPNGERIELGETGKEEVMASARYYIHAMFLEEILRVHHIIAVRGYYTERVFAPDRIAGQLTSMLNGSLIEPRRSGIRSPDELNRMDFLAELKLSFAKLARFLEGRYVNCSANQFLSHFSFKDVSITIKDTHCDWQSIHEGLLVEEIDPPPPSGRVKWIKDMGILYGLIGSLFEKKVTRTHAGKAIPFRLTKYKLNQVHHHFLNNQGQPVTSDALREGKRLVKEKTIESGYIEANFHIDTDELFTEVLPVLFPMESDM